MTALRPVSVVHAWIHTVQKRTRRYRTSPWASEPIELIAETIVSYSHVRLIGAILTSADFLLSLSVSYEFSLNEGFNCAASRQNLRAHLILLER